MFIAKLEMGEVNVELCQEVEKGFSLIGKSAVGLNVEPNVHDPNEFQRKQQDVRVF